MVQAKCVQKFRDKNNNIKGYLLEDYNGKQLRIAPDQLKNAIFMEQINVINLKLTKDGKLIDNTSEVTVLAKQAKPAMSDREIFNKLWDYLKRVNVRSEEQQLDLDTIRKNVNKLMSEFYGVEFKQLLAYTESKVYYAGAIAYDMSYPYSKLELSLYNEDNRRLDFETTDKEEFYKYMVKSKDNTRVTHSNIYDIFIGVHSIVEKIEEKYSNIVDKVYISYDAGHSLFLTILDLVIKTDEDTVKCTFAIEFKPNIHNKRYPITLSIGYSTRFMLEDWHKIDNTNTHVWEDVESDWHDMLIEDAPNCVRDIQITIVNAMKKQIEIAKKHNN